MKLAQFLWLPSVSGVARENYTSNGGFADKNWTSDLIVNVSVPLYDRGQRYAQLNEDRARLSQAQAQLAVSRARARSDWLAARANLVSSAAVVQQTESQEQLANRAQVQVEASYRAGVSTSLDLSAADQTGLVEAQTLRTLEEGLAFRPEVARPSALRAQRLGLGPILLHEGEAGLALLLAQDLAEHASERVHVAAERVLFVIARA